jgi:hypothetical protein
LGSATGVSCIAVSETAIFAATKDGIRVFDRSLHGIAPNGTLRETPQHIPFVTDELVVADDGLTIYAVDPTGYSVSTIVPTGMSVRYT